MFSSDLGINASRGQRHEHVAMFVERRVGVDRTIPLILGIAVALCFLLALASLVFSEADAMAQCQAQHSFATCHVAVVG